MSVIRPGSAATRPVFLSIRDAEEEARQIVSSAKERAASEANAAHAQSLEQGKREGYVAGFEQGRRQGEAAALEEMRERLSAAAAALADAAERFEAAQTQLQQVLPRDCAELAMAVARRIIKREAEIHPDVLAENLRHAVQLVAGASRLRIAFHPDDRAALDAALTELRASLPAIDGATVVEDASVSRGGCRVYTDTGMVDADLDNQLDRLIQQLIPSGGGCA
jgi:flagellar assembly protein FliH